MLSRIPTALVTILMTASMSVASLDMAQARKGRKGAFAAGVAVGVLGLGAVGVERRGRGRCERGPVRCRWVRGDCHYNRYDDLVCESRFRKCTRTNHCD
jgi:hypothetical protein